MKRAKASSSASLAMPRERTWVTIMSRIKWGLVFWPVTRRAARENVRDNSLTVQGVPLGRVKTKSWDGDNAARWVESQLSSAG
mmetsp:Transcript_7058/g.28505  ORF Transcript_7058/g.28505 Transcript_7058/m.28505 type:complete len:83 (-) Transcript_7058:1228-1476(-)